MLSSEERISQLEKDMQRLAERHEREIQDLLDQVQSELAEARSRLRSELSETRQLAPERPFEESARRIASLSTEIDSLQQQLSWTEHRLERSERSPFGRIARTGARIENRLAPPGSARRRMTATLRTGATVLLLEGPRIFATVLRDWLRGERGYWKRYARDSTWVGGSSPEFDERPSPKALIAIDEPARGDRVQPDTRLVGWAVDLAAGEGEGPGVDAIRVFLGSRANGRLIGEVRTSLPRTDPAEHFGLDRSYEFCGFEAELEELPPGRQILTVCTVRNERVTGSIACSISVVPWSAEDTPSRLPISDPGLRAFARREEPSAAEFRRQRRATRWSVRPRFDILSCAEGASEADLLATAESLRNQTYANWTWYVESERQQDTIRQLSAREDRIRPLASPVDHRTAPGNGDYAVPLHLGDRLAPNALYSFASEIRSHPQTALVFTDEDQLDDRGGRHKPFFKPDWSPELALSTSLVRGLAAFRRPLPNRAGLETLTDHSSAWDLSLQIHHAGGEIRHVPRLLCHRRSTTGPIREAEIARLLSDELARRGVRSPEVMILPGGEEGLRPRLRWKPAADHFVSIVMPSRTPELAARCLDSLLTKSADTRFEIILVVTGGPPGAWRRLTDTFGRLRIDLADVGHENGTFNFQRACNTGRKRARGDTLLFLNDDVLVTTEDWLSRLLQWLDLESVGAVGPKLVYPDGRIQHAGVVVGMTGFASHVYRSETEESSSSFTSHHWYRNCSALTAACLLVPSRVFDSVGGFDERFAVLFGDVDFCLRLRQAGYRLVYTPDVRLIHRESVTRHHDGKEHLPRSDWELFTRLWFPELARGDPFYNRNLSVADEHPDLKRGARDTPLDVNEDWMARLPNRALITLPDDLQGLPVEAFQPL